MPEIDLLIEYLGTLFYLAVGELEVEIVKNGEKYHDLEEVKMLKNKWKKAIEYIKF